MNTLQARFDSRNEFYGKAYYTGDNVKKLYSYTTLVASIKDGEVKLHNVKLHSATTRRHVVEFVKQFAPRATYILPTLYKKKKVAHY